MIAFAFPYPMLGLSGGAQSLRVETRSGGVGSWCKSTRLYCGKSVGAKTGRVFMCDSQPDSDKGRIQRWFADRKLSAARLRQYGVAAVVSYGLFDAVTYAISLFLAVRAYVAAGKVLTLQAAPQVLLAMWGINNFSRPLRVSGALAIAPFVNRRVVEPIREILRRRREG